MTNLQLTTGRSRSQSAHHLQHRRILKTDPVNNYDGGELDCFYWFGFFSGTANAELLACKFVGNSVLVFSEMRAMES